MAATNGNHRKLSKSQLAAVNAALEEQVASRTAALAEVVRALQVEQLEHARAEQDLRAAYAALEHQATQLRGLAGQLTEAEQRERRRLAQLLHDDLQQWLFAACFKLKTLSCDGADESVARTAREIEEIIAQCLKQSRLLIAELSPPVLYVAGLSAALQWLGDVMRERHGLIITVEAEREAEPDDENARTLLFQAVRELSFNVVKHARVNRARVTMTKTSSQETRIEVCDAGVGFDPSHVEMPGAPDRRFGLVGIRERLGLLGGQIEIISAPGKGTRAVLRVPLRQSLLPARVNQQSCGNPTRAVPD